jgi:hypothetical protein
LRPLGIVIVSRYPSRNFQQPIQRDRATTSGDQIEQ